ncbi:MAG: SpoIID/LytB domain-containing protein [Lachnospiraceae bacterium]|nr:SpoIID/LytB domain-containing protein [Lachnospiraceae bacterium]
MKKNERILIKIAVIAVLTMLFIWLVYQDEKVYQLSQPEGELAEADDVRILVSELQKNSAGKIKAAELAELIEKYLGEEKEYIQYAEYLELLDCLIGQEGQSEEGDRLKKSITYKDKYKEDFYILKKDWYDSYAKLVRFYGLEDVLKEERIEILCGNSDLVGEEEIGEDCLLGREGRVYPFISGKFSSLKFATVKAYVSGDMLLTLTDVLSDKSELENIWIMEAEEENIRFFYEGYEILAQARGAVEDPLKVREQVADLSYKSGDISGITVKSDRIGGKLLGIDDDQIEIEGHGKVPIKENCIGYMLYEALRRAERSELSIGYDFADFVLDDGEICAFLITKKDKMETIRVAIRNNHFESLYHDRFVFCCQDTMTIYYGDYDNRKQEEISAGQELVIEGGSKYLSGDRVEIVPGVNTGKIQVLSLQRSQGTPSYRGKMEIVKADDGLILINEVLLEEYLYSVVPSEMPASYPVESLKAQAICARTYGYQYLKHPGYERLGAHVDDSVGYQVYNNIAENVNSTKAVKETAGMLLLYEEEPVSTYYYSTSCGFGADAGVWNEDQKENLPYLKSIHIAKQEEGDEILFAEDLTKEENFRAYISQIDENAYEKEEAWFRWTYQVEELDEALLGERLRERYDAGAGKILTYTGTGNPDEDPEHFESKKPEKFRTVYDIRCLKRKEGGVLEELLIETDKGIYKVLSEYNIRYILNQNGQVIRQDGSVSEGFSLLPSAYLIIDVVKSGKDMVGYTIIGGGYGHGVGMSQNGAKTMGLENMDCESILSFFFKDCRIDKIY